MPEAEAVMVEGNIEMSKKTLMKTLVKKLTLKVFLGVVIVQFANVTHLPLSLCICNIISYVVEAFQYHHPFLLLQSRLVAPMRSSTFKMSTPSRTKTCQT